jgi:hypothetical protein
MVVVMEKNASSADVDQVQERLRRAGFQIHLSQGVERTIIGAVGDRSRVDLEFLEALPGVDKVVPIMKPFKLTSREFQQEDTVVAIGEHSIGDGSIQVIAGPCAVESREKYLEVAAMVKDAGATMLRGGAFKPRTSPYSFQGLEEEGLKILAEARELTGLPVITEVMDQRSTAMGLGFQVLKAAELARQGYNRDDIIPELVKVRTAVKILFIVDNLEYLVRGGRLGKASGLLGNLLQVKPILGVVDGRIELMEKVRSKGRAVKHIIEILKKQAESGLVSAVSVIHADNDAEALELKKQVEEFFTGPILLSEVGPTIGSHVGPGALGLIYY